MKIHKVGGNMKTIEIKSNGQIAQFTTKSVTFDGKEFFYSRMENLKHDAAGYTYSFTYDGESKTLPYDARYEKILDAIFSQVKALQARKAAQAAAGAAKTNANDKNVQPAPAAEKEAESAGEAAPPAESTASSNTESATDDTAQSGEPVVFTDKKAAKQAEKERKKAEKAKKKEEKKRMKAEKAALKAAGKSADASAKATDAEGSSSPEGASEESYDPKNDPERKRKIKKAVITFAIVIAAMAVIAVVYHFIFGTSDNPSSLSPNSEGSQQYDDIDQLIEDLQ